MIQTACVEGLQNEGIAAMTKMASKIYTTI